MGSGFTTLTNSNEEMNDIMKIVKSLEEPGSLIKGVSETIQIEAKKQNGGLLSLLLGILGAGFSRTLLASKGATAMGQGRGTIGAGDGTIRPRENF